MPVFRSPLFRLLLLLSVFGLGTHASAQPLTYDIVASRMRRTADNMHHPDVDTMVAGGATELVLIHPDGSVEVLDNPGPKGGVFRPVLSFDGKRVAYGKSPNTVDAGGFGYMFPAGGFDIYEMDLETRVSRRLTYGKLNPSQTIPQLDPTTGQPQGQGIVFNVGPCYVPGPNGTEEIVFSSTRHDFHTVKAANAMHINFQLYRMDRNGRNLRPIDNMDTGDALDPEILMNGWISYSSAQAQGSKSPTIWGLWTVRPDGTGFGSIFPGLRWGASYHFASQLSNGEIVSTEYYNGNNFGYGAILAVASVLNSGLPPNGDANPRDPSNPLVRYGWRFDGINWGPAYTSYTFSPQGLRNLTGFTFGSPDDPANFLPNGQRSGKATHPSGAPNNDMLFIYSPGTVNKMNPYVWGQIRLLQGGVAIDDPDRARIIVADPNYNYLFPRPVVPYKRIYGIDRPPYLAYLPNGKVPYGLIGSASLLNRDVTSGTGIELGNGQRTTPRGFVDLETSMAWSMQGAETGKYSDEDIAGVRIVAMDPAKRTNSGPVFSSSAVGERLRIIGEIPVRKADSNGVEPLDGDGRPDTSFLATIPADVAFTFQTIDRDGMTLNMAQTWHQVRPGESRFDCGGCHAHAHQPTDFSKTAAARADYYVWNLVDYVTMFATDQNGRRSIASYTGAEARNVRTIEYLRDIRPILNRSCVSCHSGSNPAGKLDLSDETLFGAYETTYLCLTGSLADRLSCKFDKTRYIIPLQARRSLLIWKIFGRRLDGLTNATFPSEAIPGDPTTFPPGANRRMLDYDYTGDIMPPPGSHVPSLTENEKLMLARWVDLGAGSDPSPAEFRDRGYFADQLGPTLNISSPRAEKMQQLTEISFGTLDYLSGVDRSRTSVKASFPVNGKAPGTELVADFVEGPKDVFTLALQQPVTSLGESDVTVVVFDNEGNQSALTTTFSVHPSGEPPPSPKPPIPRGPEPPTTPPGPPQPDPERPVRLQMVDGPVDVVLVAKKGKWKPRKVPVRIEVRNVSLPKNAKVQLVVSGTGRKQMGIATNRWKLNMKKGSRSKSYKLNFRTPGQYVLNVQLDYPGGSITKQLIFQVRAP